MVIGRLKGTDFPVVTILKVRHIGNNYVFSNMMKSSLDWVNVCVLGLSGVFLLSTAGITLLRQSEIEQPRLPKETTRLPKGAFEWNKEKYDEIGPPFVNLRFSPLELQLPDLRNYMVYNGRNERPDANMDQSRLHFSFVGAKEIASIPADKPLYLVYDKDQPKIKYLFSKGNAETSLWIEGTPGEKEVTVNVAMKNEAGEIIRKPELFAQFKLKEKELSRFGTDKWELGKWKVDGTLLARQRARWSGKDLFLAEHGGKEFEDLVEKQRIDFGQDNEAYSVYLNIGDGLVWKNDRWVPAQSESDSQNYPLLVLKTIEDRLMRLDLWDVEGKSKLALNLIKSIETPIQPNITQAFKFVGARTRTQFMFEVNGERVLIGPGDWLLLSQGNWMNLRTPEEIDHYVDRLTVGPLFVIDQIRKEDGKQTLNGTIYSTSRTDKIEVEIPLQQNAQPVPPQKVNSVERRHPGDGRPHRNYDHPPVETLSSEKLPRKFSREEISYPSRKVAENR